MTTPQPKLTQSFIYNIYLFVYFSEPAVHCFVYNFRNARKASYFRQKSYDSWKQVWNRTHFLSAFAKLRKATISFVMSLRPSVCLSVCPHGTTRLPLDGFS